ncbi:RNA polymerase sigma factor SigA [Caulifigura coniformis]|uniref:RNA polymerase sigma factor SigA n=1 Tax=Caulifigura coniformis TaxID=2527983 RepID=A0A517SK35_9PLAN|nr:sigma-70 family RNA polymerase sigma factor [Caulifigura coniformis]QDT56484.1 RNA polymerase sigma factor SigA [Caulifigura coniformis]
MSRFHHSALQQLTEQQVRSASEAVRLDQLDRAETVIATLEPGSQYRVQDLCEQVTHTRPKYASNLVIQGSEAAHDLGLFVEELSESLNMPADLAGEPVLTVEDVSQQYNVSTKTVDRWRKRGLVSRRFQFGNRSRVGFLKSSIDRFVRSHESEISRGSRFSQLSSVERGEIMEAARHLVRYGTCPADVSRSLATRFNRSPETIRAAIRQHDEESPDNRVFATPSDELTPERKQELLARYSSGVSVDALARDYCRTRTGVYRAIAEARAEKLCAAPVAFMDSPEFHQPNASKVILGPPPAVDRKAARVKAPAGLPAYLASLYSNPLLTREEEGYWFRKMNFLKFQASQIQSKIDMSRPKSADLDELERLLDEANEVKNFLIRSNLRLVVSIAKKRLQPGMSFFEMVSDGNMSLMRAIEKFDYTKGNKFSTYSTWAIMKNYARSIPAEHTILDRFRTGNEEVFAASADGRGVQTVDETTNARQRDVITSILGQLDERERSILLHRYGLQQGSEPLTLEEVGTRFGVTKERIRQIEARALQKLRKIAEEEKLDIPGV